MSPSENVAGRAASWLPSQLLPSWETVRSRTTELGHVVAVGEEEGDRFQLAERVLGDRGVDSHDGVHPDDEVSSPAVEHLQHGEELLTMRRGRAFPSPGRRSRYARSPAACAVVGGDKAEDLRAALGEFRVAEGPVLLLAMAEGVAPISGPGWLGIGWRLSWIPKSC